MSYKIYFLTLLGLSCYVPCLHLDITSSIPVLEERMDQCFRESRANPNHVKWVKRGWYSVGHTIPNPALKSWVLCYLIKNGVMSPEGVLKQHVVLQNIPDHDKGKIEKIINKCMYKSPHKPVDTAWNYLTCFRRRNSKYSMDATGL